MLMYAIRIKGKLYVRGDSKTFRFQNGKSESLALQRKNPRRIAWTVLFRRQHKKGISEVSSGSQFDSDSSLGSFNARESSGRAMKLYNRLFGASSPGAARNLG